MTKQPKRVNGSPQFSFLDILSVCTLPDGRIIIPPDYAELTVDELGRLYKVAESAIELAHHYDTAIGGTHHAVKEIMSLCTSGAVVKTADLPDGWKG